jgi:hypothetical protein
VEIVAAGASEPADAPSIPLIVSRRAGATSMGAEKQLREEDIMFDPSISERPTTALRHDIPPSRPIRFQSASEERILSFFLQFTIEERAGTGRGAATASRPAWRASALLPVMTSSVLGEMASIEATTSL